MLDDSFSKKTCLLILFIIFSLLITDYVSAAATQLKIEITAPAAVCGNNIKETGEQCDGSALGGATCASRGFAGGTLSCQSNCTFNTSNCTSGGGGGGGGSYVPPPTETKVIIKGKAYPLSSITILKDGSVVATTISDSQANFKIEITDITAGTWTFGVWAEDKKERKSITFSFTTSVTSGMTTSISGIFLPPTIDLSETVLEKGETLNILGQTAPESDVSVFINSTEEIVEKTKAGTDGTWSYGFDTSILKDGSHTTRAKATSSEGLLSTFSQVLAFYIGKGAPGVICFGADLNSDGKVNLVDFSILLFWWGKDNSCADQNSDGKVNLTDFSIIMYYWTG